MKTAYKIFWTLFFALFIFACDDGDDSGVDYTDGPVNRWVYETLRKDYLWNDEVEAKDPDYSRSYDKFFNSILSDNDGKHTDGSNYYYSYIQKVSKTAKTRAEEDLYESSFGFDFILTRSYLYDEMTSSSQVYLKVYVTVAYVIPDSPADKAGLKRGDFIGVIDSKEIPTNGYSELVGKLLPESSTGQSPRALNVTKYVLEVADDIQLSEPTRIPVVRRVKQEDGKDGIAVHLSPANVSRSPIIKNEVYTVNGKKVGYLVYGQFEYGSQENHEFDNDLKNVMREFKDQGVRELVLDLRYNPGGYVSSCRLLSSIIAPSSALGNSTFQVMKFNSTDKNRDLKFLTESEMSGESFGMASGVNLGLDKVYILATHASASASEALIHGLRGVNLPVYHIGNRTEGKNVGMSLYTSDGVKGLDYETFRYDVWPVTFYIYNGKNETYPAKGIEPLESPTPGYVYYEDFDIGWKELGDIEEPLLNAALTHIDTGAFPASVGRSASSTRSDARVVRPVGQPKQEYVAFPRRNAVMKEEGR